MPKSCPIASGEARIIDKYHYNRYCATSCDVTFPDGCLGNCGWPEMKQARKCRVRHLCPCRARMDIADRIKRLDYVAETKRGTGDVIDDVAGEK